MNNWGSSKNSIIFNPESRNMIAKEDHNKYYEVPNIQKSTA